MAERRKITDGANDRPVDTTIAGTGPGIPDDALLPGQDLPDAPDDAEVARIAKSLNAPVPENGTGRGGALRDGAGRDG